ncbi:hypothetical protein D3C86_1306790 [compost metagenome]
MFLAAQAAHAAGDLEAVDIAQRRVEQDGGRRLFHKETQGFLARGGEPPGKPQTFEYLREDDLVDPVILDEKYLADAAGLEYFGQILRHDLPVLVSGFLLRGGFQPGRKIMQQGSIYLLFLDGDDGQIMRGSNIEASDAHLGVDNDHIDAHTGGSRDIDECALLVLARHRRMVHAARSQKTTGGFRKAPVFRDDQHRLAL